MSSSLVIYGRGQHEGQLSPPFSRHSNSVDQRVCRSETTAAFPVAPASTSGRVTSGEKDKELSEEHRVQWCHDAYAPAVPAPQQAAPVGSYM